MSVLIKGITLEQFYRDLNNVRDMDVGWNAVQLPPHGRLIDADALAKKMRGVVFRGEEKDVLHHNVQVFLGAPTIIESEEEDAKNN